MGLPLQLVLQFWIVNKDDHHVFRSDTLRWEVHLSVCVCDKQQFPQQSILKNLFLSVLQFSWNTSQHSPMLTSISRVCVCVCVYRVLRHWSWRQDVITRVQHIALTGKNLFTGKEKKPGSSTVYPSSQRSIFSHSIKVPDSVFNRMSSYSTVILCKPLDEPLWELTLQMVSWQPFLRL